MDTTISQFHWFKLAGGKRYQILTPWGNRIYDCKKSDPSVVAYFVIEEIFSILYDGSVPLLSAYKSHRLRKMPRTAIAQSFHLPSMEPNQRRFRSPEPDLDFVYPEMIYPRRLFWNALPRDIRQEILAYVATQPGICSVSKEWARVIPPLRKYALLYKWQNLKHEKVESLTYLTLFCYIWSRVPNTYVIRHDSIDYGASGANRGFSMYSSERGIKTEAHLDVAAGILRSNIKGNQARRARFRKECVLADPTEFLKHVRNLESDHTGHVLFERFPECKHPVCALDRYFSQAHSNWVEEVVDYLLCLMKSSMDVCMLSERFCYKTGIRMM